MENERNHAKRNAVGWMDTIQELVAALEMDFERYAELKLKDMTEDDMMTEDEKTELAELTETATVEGEGYADADAVRKRIEEGPLSVQVRSGWYSPGEPDNTPDEFEILLSTGGPALRIIGDLDRYGQPDRPRLQYQDWGTPWTEYCDVDEETLTTYCACFYFGG